MTPVDQRRDGAESLALRTAKPAVDDLPLDHGAQERDIFWRVEDIQEPGACAQQLGCRLPHGDAPGLRRNCGFGQVLPADDLSHQGNFESQTQREIRCFLAGEDLAHDRHIHRSQQKCRLIAEVGRTAHGDALSALHEHRQAELQGRREARSWGSSAVQRQPWDGGLVLPDRGKVCNHFASEHGAQHHEP